MSEEQVSLEISETLPDVAVKIWEFIGQEAPFGFIALGETGRQENLEKIQNLTTNKRAHDTDFRFVRGKHNCHLTVKFANARYGCHNSYAELISSVDGCAYMAQAVSCVVQSRSATYFALTPQDAIEQCSLIMDVAVLAQKIEELASGVHFTKIYSVEQLEARRKQSQLSAATQAARNVVFEFGKHMRKRKPKTINVGFDRVPVTMLPGTYNDMYFRHGHKTYSLVAELDKLAMTWKLTITRTS